MTVTTSRQGILAAALVFFAAWGVFAQSTENDAGVFSPFVSGLTAETRNNLVRLSWNDSRDVTGPVFIFRSVRPFTGSDLADLRPVEISWGTRSYVDETEGAGPFYYFIAASDTRGQRYDIFIPYTNTTTAVFSPVTWAEAQPAPPAAAAVPPAVVSPAAQTMAAQAEAARPAESAELPEISGLTAVAEGTGVIISFAAGGSSKNAVLYRNTRPIAGIQDLLSAAIVQPAVSSPFIDYPAPGASYYYAVLFEDDISRGAVEVQPGRNATLNAAEVAGITPEAAPDMRAMPLPALSIYKTSPASDYYSELPKAAPLRPETTAALDTVERTRPEPPPARRPRVFARDLELPSGGEESILRTIVQGPLVKREWQNACDDLLHYLSLPRSAPVEARARFYLGQSYYFLGKNREALIEFLFVQGRYPAEANEWIEAALSALAY